MDRHNLKVYLVDLDGVLCKGDSYNERECKRAKPIQKNIRKINKLYMTNFIVIYTARKDFLIPITLEWLRANKVNFHAISNNKVSADIYIDNRAMRPEEIK